MRILITRPINESLELAKIIENLGHTPIIAPLLEIEYLKEIPLVNKNVIITSKNAIFSIKDLNKDTQIFVVGKKTRDSINDLGFRKVCFAGETVAELKKKINQKEPLIYASGNDVTDALEEFPNVQRVIVYNAKKIAAPSKDFIDFFLGQDLRICMIFSQRTAEILYKLVNEYALQSKCANIVLLALSSKIVKPLEGLSFECVRVAKRPDLDNMLNLLSLYHNG